MGLPTADLGLLASGLQLWEWLNPEEECCLAEESASIMNR